jgi:signal peptidase II
MTRIRRTVTFLALVITMAGCDRVTKHMALTSLKETPVRSFLADTVRLEYAENAGGFLSLGANLQPAIRTIIFKIGIGLGLLSLLLVVIKRRWTGWPLIGGGLVFAGGVSNWVDRITRDNVIDFLNVGFGTLRTGIFNVADVSALLGVFILALTYSQRNRDVNGAMIETHGD